MGRSGEVGQHRPAGDAGVVDVFAIGTPLVQVGRVIIEPGVDGGRWPSPFAS
jgi:hypothetical protein